MAYKRILLKLSGQALMGDRDYGIDPKRLAEYAEDINRSGQFLLEVINDILDMSKIDAGKMSVEKTETHPVKIVKEVISLSIGSHNLNLADTISFIQGYC